MAKKHPIYHECLKDQFSFSHFSYLKKSIESSKMTFLTLFQSLDKVERHFQSRGLVGQDLVKREHSEEDITLENFQIGFSGLKNIECHFRTFEEAFLKSVESLVQKVTLSLHNLLNEQSKAENLRTKDLLKSVYELVE